MLRLGGNCRCKTLSIGKVCLEQTPLVAPAGAATQEEKERLLAMQSINRGGLGIRVLQGGRSEAQDALRDGIEIDEHESSPDLGCKHQMLAWPSSPVLTPHCHAPFTPHSSLPTLHSPLTTPNSHSSLLSLPASHSQSSLTLNPHSLSLPTPHSNSALLTNCPLSTPYSGIVYARQAAVVETPPHLILLRFTI